MQSQWVPCQMGTIAEYSPKEWVFIPRLPKFCSDAHSCCGAVCCNGNSAAGGNIAAQACVLDLF